MKSLTKENFWNALRTEFPEEVEVFCKWIDEYKKSIDWNKLFNHGSPHYNTQGWHDPRFHDLPIELQIGIILRFSAEVNTCFGPINMGNNIPNEIRAWFKREHAAGVLKTNTTSLREHGV